MTDLHCHILPGVDDGASSMDEALSMAQLAVSSGITCVVATPHFFGVPESVDALPTFSRALEQLRRSLSQVHIPLTVLPGAEILCTPLTPDMAARGDLPTLADTRYVLTEFYFDETGDFMADILDDIHRWGYIPIVAHPERYEAVQQDLGLAAYWLDRGYVLQGNKGSVLGALGRRSFETAHAMLEQGMLHLLASDAHHDSLRTPYMGDLQQFLLERMDADAVQLLLQDNPRRVLSGEMPRFLR